jgi:nucleotide-binding universal stress UspA family protein
MTRKILAAIDTSAAAGPVLATGRAIAKLYDATVEAVHVREGSAEAAGGAAERAEVPLRILPGSPLDTLRSLAGDDEVVAVVLGARSAPLGKRPAGHVTVDIITSLRKPVVVVPPHASAVVAFERMLVPLEGTLTSAAALAAVIERAHAHGLDVVLLHVRGESSVPRFSEQSHYEMEAWADEFLARYCSGTPRGVRLEVRVGSACEQIVRAVEQTRCGLIALGWGQVLAANRAQVVRQCLAQSSVPMLLVPTDEQQAVAVGPSPGARR